MLAYRKGYNEIHCYSIGKILKYFRLNVNVRPVNYTVWIPSPGERQQTISEPSDQQQRLQTRRGMDRKWGSPREGSDYKSRGSARGLTCGNKQQNLEGLEQQQARLQQRERPIRDRKQWRSRSKDRWEES